MAKKSTAFSVIDLKKELNEGKLRPVYLFFGEESYIKGKYERKITDLIPDAGFPEFNHFKFEGSMTELSDYDDALESFPMMTDKKLILIRDSKIFKRANDDVKTFWQEKLKRLSDDTVIVFSEDEVDKRSVLYKAVQKAGAAVEFEYQNEADLVAWVTRRALKSKLKMTKDCAKYMVGIIDPGLSNLNNEFDKLEAYCTGTVTKTDIDRVVSKSMSIRIFDLTDAIMYRRADTAMKVVSELRTSNESAFGILYLLEGSAEKILKTKLCGTKNKFEAAKIVGIAPFIAEKYLQSAKFFSTDSLIRMITRVPEIDSEIKSGNIEQWAALEQYIAECIHYGGNAAK
ncbi:MAG: DNA polymerase III subunit delta [bacterium]|nr:DNA polymerase III subunit delta [bacterium]